MTKRREVEVTPATLRAIERGLRNERAAPELDRHATICRAAADVVAGFHPWATEGAAKYQQLVELDSAARRITGPNGSLSRLGYDGPRPNSPLAETRLPRSFLDALASIAALANAGRFTAEG